MQMMYEMQGGDEVNAEIVVAVHCLSSLNFSLSVVSWSTMTSLSVSERRVENIPVIRYYSGL